jgi:hypothetical protein
MDRTKAAVNFSATLRPSRAHSSAGERSLHTREVPGSIPGAPTRETPANDTILDSDGPAGTTSGPRRPRRPPWGEGRRAPSLERREPRGQVPPIPGEPAARVGATFCAFRCALELELLSEWNEKPAPTAAATATTNAATVRIGPPSSSTRDHAGTTPALPAGAIESYSELLRAMPLETKNAANAAFSLPGASPGDAGRLMGDPCSIPGAPTRERRITRRFAGDRRESCPRLVHAQPVFAATSASRDGAAA